MGKRKKARACSVCDGHHRKKTARQCIKEQLWKSLREAMHWRDGGVCLKCGSRDDIQMSHVYRRSQCGRLAFDLNNVKSLCGKCHLGWWHRNEAEGGVWFATKYPKRWEYLQARLKEYREDPGTISMDWYRDRLKELQDASIH